MNGVQCEKSMHEFTRRSGRKQKKFFHKSIFLYIKKDKRNMFYKEIRFSKSIHFTFKIYNFLKF